MHFTFYLTALVAPLSILAAPTNIEKNVETVVERQKTLVKPPPCVRNPAATTLQTQRRSQEFAHAFIYKKDITEAFTFIVSDYINHNPLAKNGSDSAWSILSPIWASQNITPLRTTFQGTQSWLEYNNTAFGQVVDRFRWEGGCIVEHWDQGEKFPSTKHV